jgi:hypothetical protein
MWRKPKASFEAPFVEQRLRKSYPVPGRFIMRMGLIAP